jgi:hypothetical protein
LLHPTHEASILLAVIPACCKQVEIQNRKTTGSRIVVFLGVREQVKPGNGREAGQGNDDL